jgi:hypothetical protein
MWGVVQVTLDIIHTHAVKNYVHLIGINEITFELPSKIGPKVIYKLSITLSIKYHKLFASALVLLRKI